MRVVFASLAESELNDASSFYALDSDIAAQGFRNEAERAAQRIAEHPRAWPVARGQIRRCRLRRFPYTLLYSIEADHVLVIAVAHMRRAPNYWITRLGLR